MPVASRTEPKAKDFAEKFGASCYYGNYEDLANDKNVDLVYIATPHATHYENTMLCLRHGKAVLCEKPFTLNYSQAESLIQYAEENKIFLSEAMWVRFQPFAKKIPELIAEGVIGEPRLVIVNKGEINNIGPSDVDPRTWRKCFAWQWSILFNCGFLGLGNRCCKSRRFWNIYGERN